jgi:membrane-associated phospholipid phosphatase
VRCITPLIVVAGLAAARPAHTEPWHHGAAGKRRITHLVLVTAGGALYVISETLAKPALAPDHCRWCNVDALDDHVRSSLMWSNPARAASISNLTGFVATPVLMFGLTALAASGAAEDGERAGRIIDDAIPILETLVYSGLVVQAVKFSFGRQRPLVHYHTNVDFVPGQDDNLSWFSGHSTLTFGLAVSAGVVAHRRGSALEPVIWATGLTLAATTAYLRVAGDKHYLTDVLTGAAFGTISGIFVPRLTHALPDNISVVPQGSGVAVLGTF